jgi:hypothetical protein
MTIGEYQKEVEEEGEDKERTIVFQGYLLSSVIKTGPCRYDMLNKSLFI